MNRNNFLKRLYPVILILIVFIIWKVRRSGTQNLQMVEISGTTMGTIGYSVKYFTENGVNYGKEIDSLLKVWNLSLSTYIPESEISRFNNGINCFEFESKFFFPVLEASRSVYENSYGAFDPTIGPLVNAWGFGPDKSIVPDSSRVDSLMRLVGFDKIHFDREKVCKELPNIKLDFSAIAKGYAVDVVADFIESKGIHNLLVEIGGELVCKGTKNDSMLWRTAIEDPAVEVYERNILAVAELKDRAVATSGNYRNYYVRDGRKYVHTINPVTGYPITHTLLSASVFADNCMLADAYATAFMVLGLDKTKTILDRVPGLDAYLIYSNEKGGVSTYMTEGIAQNIEELDVQD
ncbi:MAG: FAD:protein FMN transferase [Cytophagales bacterium]|nr:FAD:protein FMN transferase [Cytophagales bacterium]